MGSFGAAGGCPQGTGIHGVAAIHGDEGIHGVAAAHLPNRCGRRKAWGRRKPWGRHDLWGGCTSLCCRNLQHRCNQGNHLQPMEVPHERARDTRSTPPRLRNRTLEEAVAGAGLCGTPAPTSAPALVYFGVASTKVKAASNRCGAVPAKFDAESTSDPVARRSCSMKATTRVTSIEKGPSPPKVCRTKSGGAHATFRSPCTRCVCARRRSPVGTMLTEVASRQAMLRPSRSGRKMWHPPATRSWCQPDAKRRVWGAFFVDGPKRIHSVARARPLAEMTCTLRTQPGSETGGAGGSRGGNTSTLTLSVASARPQKAGAHTGNSTQTHPTDILPRPKHARPANPIMNTDQVQSCVGSRHAALSIDLGNIRKRKAFPTKHLTRRAQSERGHVSMQAAGINGSAATHSEAGEWSV